LWLGRLLSVVWAQAAQGAGLGINARAIFLMFWAAVASRHWQATATRPRKRE